MSSAFYRLSPEQAAVASQYEQWVYPLPIPDLSQNRDAEKITQVAPKDLHWLYWPDGQYLNGYKEKIRILVAGCGANSAARQAFLHPNASVVGIDLSQKSLDHEAFLKERHQLSNLTLYQLPLEHVARLGQQFDFIESVGVLHHLPNPLQGLRALKQVLAPGGVMALMLYAQYGRAGVYMLQKLFKLLGVGQSPKEVGWVKETLEYLPASHPVAPLLEQAADITFDAGVVDLFLNPIDRPFTVKACLDLVQQSQLVFQGWLNNYFYYPEGHLPASHPLMHQLQSLPKEQLWQCMELFYGQILRHGFYVCQPERCVSSYKIDFDSNAFLSFTPRIREDVTLNPGMLTAPLQSPNSFHQNSLQPSQQSPRLTRPGMPAIPLNNRQYAFFLQMNGTQTIEMCLKNSKLPVSATGKGAETWEEQVQSIRNFCRGLWRMGYLMVQLP